jgi:ABC-type bacteriocin/lantibiotic exporter with double-glycine peptidase domain
MLTKGRVAGDAEAGNFKVAEFLILFGILNLGYILSKTFTVLFFLAGLANKAGKAIFIGFVTKIFSLPMSFFEKTPVGIATII